MISCRILLLIIGTALVQGCAPMILEESSPLATTTAAISGAATKVVLTDTGEDFQVGNGTAVIVQVQDASGSLKTDDNGTQITVTPSGNGYVSSVTTGTGDGSYGVAGGAEVITVSGGIVEVVIADDTAETISVSFSNNNSLSNPSDDSIDVNAATYWIKQLGNATIGGGAAGFDGASGVQRDTQGNIYFAGVTNGSLGETNAGGFDIFIAKFNSGGTLLWVKQLGDTTRGASASGNDYVMGLELDSSNNIYLAGYTDGSLGETSAGGNDAIMAKFNSDGTLLWLTQMGNSTVGAGAASDEFVFDVALDSSGNAYLCGYTDGSLAETSGGGNDAFLAKFNSSGALQWTRQMGNTTIGAGAANGDSARACDVDSSGNPFIAGDTTGDLIETNGNNANDYDFFIAKYNSSGTYQWGRQMGNTTIGAAAGGADKVDGMLIDGSDNIFLTGVTDASLGETNGGFDDMVLAKYNSSGVYQWVRQLGDTTLGAGADFSEIGYEIAVDSSSNIYVVGKTNGSMGETKGGNNDVFVAQFNSAGTYQWTSQLGDTTMGTDADGDDWGLTIDIDSSGSIYIGGYTSGTLGDEVNGGSNDAFIVKLNSTGGGI